MRRCGVLVLILVAVSAMQARAVTVEGIQFQLGLDINSDGLFYTKSSSSQGQFFLSDAPMDPTLINGEILVAGGQWGDYEIRDASLTMTPVNLLQDASFTTSDSSNPKIAKGKFAGGAVLTITGSITTVDGAQTVFPTGTILTATVNAAYWAQEQLGITGANTLDAQQLLTVTGGELATGAVTGFVLSPSVVMDLTCYFCSQVGNPGMNLEDFQSDINYMLPSTVQINPEPVSAALFGIGAVLLGRRRQAKP
jgi:hypothetical protein